NKMSFYFQSREWMDQRIDPESNQVSEIFLGGVDAFIQFACNQEDYKERETLLCPCARCKNVKQREARVVARHLFLYGFKGNYYFWTSHGEKFNDLGESSGANHSTGEEEMLETPIWNAYEDHHLNIPEGESVVNAQLVDNTVLQTFMMLNCETFAPYERMFEEYMTRSIPDITPVAMQKAKDTNFAEWCKDYDDRRDQVAESSLLRVETHVVDDVSDYDLAPVNPPNDEYVSDVEMNSTRAPGTQAASPPMPPGATGPAVYHAASPPMPPGATGPAVYHAGSPPMPPGATGAAPNHAASSSRSNSYPQMTLNAMLNSPARLSQPHLHPDKPNGALWFGIDPCIHAFIRATWQGYYMGPWKSWNKVPEERKDSWWQTFVQNFYWEPQFNDLVYGLWKKETMTTVGERISKKKRQHKKPKYINDSDWTLLLEYWATDEAKKKSKKAAKSRKADPVGKGCHKHNAGPRCFARIAYNMTQASGEPPSYTALVRETHSRPDGTFVDYRAEELVTQAEMEATQLSNTEGSPGSPSASSAPSRLMLNKAYLKNAKSKRGYVYGLGSEQFREHAPSSRVPNGIARNLDLEMRVGGLETTLQSVTSDVAGVKQDVSDMRQDFAATREAINQLLQTLRPPQAPTGQTSDHQAQAPTGQPNPLNGI
ncbi:hypothetical protein HID58_014917, partial [Brassica napus]